MRLFRAKSVCYFIYYLSVTREVKSEGAWPVHLGEKMASGRSYRCLQIPGWRIRRRWSQTPTWNCIVIGRKAMGRHLILRNSNEVQGKHFLP